MCTYVYTVMCVCVFISIYFENENDINSNIISFVDNINIKYNI